LHDLARQPRRVAISLLAAAMPFPGRTLALAMLAKGVIDSEAMITNRYPLDAYQSAIDTFLAGSGLKVQVGPGMP
jgi:threonine dehydrogenase-like Zn-dependent dehydrogenase